MHTSDRISGVVIIGLGALAIIGGLQLPPMPGQDVGPSAFPITVGVGLVISGLLVVAGIGHRIEEQAQAELAAVESATVPDDVQARGSWRAAIPPVLLILYVALAEPLGFVLTAALLVLLASLALGARVRLALPLAILGPVVVHLLFAKLLRVPLPAGLLPMPW
jgi:putative tricarboxylic transport membrane protein